MTTWPPRSPGSTALSSPRTHLAASLHAIPVSQVKGLEYDRVVLVEPADIVAAEPRGMNRLYVALTRAVAELVILHTKPLPFDRPPLSG